MGALTLMAGAVVVGATATHPGNDVARRGSGPDLVLVVLDSMRADRFSTVPPHPATPELSRLAAAGRVYTSAWAASSWTVPSVARLLSLTAGADTPDLPARLAARGYRTAAFTDNPHLSRSAPLMGGFDRVERSVPRWRSVVLGTALGELLERLLPGSDQRLATKAIAWAERQTGPFFLFAHLMDSHTPYRFPPLDGKRHSGRRIEFPLSDMPLTSEEADSIRARYDGGVRSADAQAGRLIAGVAARGRPFLAIVTSDHGESLGESRRWFHGKTLAPELLAVPLVLAGAGVEPGTADTPVGHATIAPTLLAAASARRDGGAGPDLRRDTAPMVVEGALPPRFAYRTDGRYKVLVDFQTGRRLLYDRLFDPAERRDIAGVEPSLVDALASGLAPPGAAHVSAPEHAERLRALGYIDR
jgi:arylsulfatase A-like enzyme